MSETSRSLSIIAYYLSEYDRKALEELGYQTFSQAYSVISDIFLRKPIYLKLRRDEFDALTGSQRKGWRNRKPATDVLNLYQNLSKLPFEQITQVVQILIKSSKRTDGSDENADLFGINDISEGELESIINSTDIGACRVSTSEKHYIRLYKRSIVESLIKLYQGSCQICGEAIGREYGITIVEGHHIIPFSKSENNDASNIMILCPNHHRLYHKMNATFDRKQSTVILENGIKLPLRINYHL